MMRNPLIICATLFILMACNKKPKERLVLKYNNILIYSDLSSRMDKSPNDSIIINQIFDYFVSSCVMPKTKINDRSSLFYSKVNSYNSPCKGLNKIDISDIKMGQERQQYVNDKNTERSLSLDLKKMREYIQCSYDVRDQYGLDILSLLHQQIEIGTNIKKTIFLKGEHDTTEVQFVNHLFLFTDGYLEFTRTEGNNKLYFGENEIKKVREYCKNNNTSPYDAICKNRTFKLLPLKSINNQFINLYVLETYDRQINPINGTIKNSGPLSDNNILKAVWEIWAKESGFKNFVWMGPTTSSMIPDDFIKTIILK